MPGETKRDLLVHVHSDGCAQHTHSSTLTHVYLGMCTARLPMCTWQAWGSVLGPKCELRCVLSVAGCKCIPHVAVCAHMTPECACVKGLWMPMSELRGHICRWEASSGTPSQPRVTILLTSQDMPKALALGFPGPPDPSSKPGQCSR